MVGDDAYIVPLKNISRCDVGIAPYENKIKYILGDL